MAATREAFQHRGIQIRPIVTTSRCHRPKPLWHVDGYDTWLAARDPLASLVRTGNFRRRESAVAAVDEMLDNRESKAPA